MASSYVDTQGDTVTCDGRHYAVMQGIKTRIVGLELNGFNSDRIEVLKQPINRGILQAIERSAYGSDGAAAMVISPLSDRLLKRKNNARDIEYSSLLTVFEASNFELKDGLDQHLGWRDVLTDDMDDYPFPQAEGAERVTIAPRTLNPLQTWLRNFDAQTLVVNVTVCVSRPWNP